MMQRKQISHSGLLGQILLDGLEEIIGENGVTAVLDQARLHRALQFSKKETLNHEPIDVVEIQAALEALYGERGGQGTVMQAGRVSFHNILRDYGDDMGLNNPEFRLHSTVHKIKDGLRILAEKFTEFFPGQILISEDETAWIWQVCCDPARTNPSLLKSCGVFISGILQEFTQWVAGGKHYLLDQVISDGVEEEIGRIRIEKQAID